LYANTKADAETDEEGETGRESQEIQSASSDLIMSTQPFGSMILDSFGDVGEREDEGERKGEEEREKDKETEGKDEEMETVVQETDKKEKQKEKEKEKEKEASPKKPTGKKFMKSGAKKGSTPATELDEIFNDDEDVVNY